MTDLEIVPSYDVTTTAAAKDAAQIFVRLSGTDTADERPAWRWSLAGIPASALIGRVQLRVKITAENIETTDTVNINSYNSTGASDPEADSAANCHSRCGGTTLVSETTNYQTTGTVTTDLGNIAVKQVQDNLSSPGTYALGMTYTNFAAAEAVDFEAQDAGTGAPVTLIVTYSVASGEGGGSGFGGFSSPRERLIARGR